MQVPQLVQPAELDCTPTHQVDFARGLICMEMLCSLASNEKQISLPGALSCNQCSAGTYSAAGNHSLHLFSQDSIIMIVLWKIVSFIGCWDIVPLQKLHCFIWAIKTVKGLDATGAQASHACRGYLTGPFKTVFSMLYQDSLVMMHLSLLGDLKLGSNGPQLASCAKPTRFVL
jgi:hypothetical protein